MKTNYLIISIIIAIALYSCGSNEDFQPADSTNTGKDSIVEYKQDLLLRKWKIYEATHDGNHDASSTGKTVEFLKGQKYNFNNSFDGVYRWSVDSTILYLDEGTQFEQGWSITTLSKENFTVSFNSPFTGKPSEWKMQPSF